jgi:hypothetical protein
LLQTAYGVYATVTDFKQEKNGKKVLSNKGRWGIALLLLSIIVNVSSDGYKDIQDRKAAATERQRQAKATEDQRHLSEALNDQRSALKENLTSVRDLAKDLENTSDRLQRTVVGRLTKVDSLAVYLSFYRDGLKKNWDSLLGTPTDDDVLKAFACLQHMSAGRMNAAIRKLRL